MPDKLTLTLDFDGVLHSYTSGWQGADVIPDPPVPGAIEFVREALKHFKVCICSSRCVGDTITFVNAANDRTYVTADANTAGISAMCNWLEAHGLSVAEVGLIEFWVAKPPSHVMIDDRALNFHGPTWFMVPNGTPDARIEMLLDFRPWNHGARHK